MKKLSLLKLAGAAALVVSGSLVQAQVTTIDPNSAASAPAAAPLLDSGVLPGQPVAEISPGAAWRRRRDSNPR